MQLLNTNDIDLCGIYTEFSNHQQPVYTHLQLVSIYGIINLYVNIFVLWHITLQESIVGISKLCTCVSYALIYICIMNPSWPQQSELETICKHIFACTQNNKPKIWKYIHCWFKQKLYSNFCSKLNMCFDAI